MFEACRADPASALSGSVGVSPAVAAVTRQNQEGEVAALAPLEQRQRPHILWRICHLVACGITDHSTPIQRCRGIRGIRGLLLVLAVQLVGQEVVVERWSVLPVAVR